MSSRVLSSESRIRANGVRKHVEQATEPVHLREHHSSMDGTATLSGYAIAIWCGRSSGMRRTLGSSSLSMTSSGKSRRSPRSRRQNVRSRQAGRTNNMKRLLLLFAPVVLGLAIFVPSASATSHVYAYSTVGYDSATDTATGYSYPHYP